MLAAQNVVYSHILINTDLWKSFPNCIQKINLETILADNWEEEEASFTEGWLLSEA